jgi:hypothetical protein
MLPQANDLIICDIIHITKIVSKATTAEAISGMIEPTPVAFVFGLERGDNAVPDRQRRGRASNL